MTTNISLADELEAVNSIYDAQVLELLKPVISNDDDNNNANTSTTQAILSLPNSPFSFSISFSGGYPDSSPPTIQSIHSTGSSTRRGDGDVAVSLLRDVLGRVFVPGQVCVFDLVEEVSLLLANEEDGMSDVTKGNEGHGLDKGSKGDDVRNDGGDGRLHMPDMSGLKVNDPSTDLNHNASQIFDEVSSGAAGATGAAVETQPNWTISDMLKVNKSSFIARACPAHSLQDATSAIGHLLSSDKKVASATHNITAWRVRIPSPSAISIPIYGSGSSSSSSNNNNVSEIIIQDCDDDGETAAGGRLLHLMQLMDVWNVVVVVTRWYGGVKLGADRFRCINAVAREVLVKAGFGKDGGGDVGGNGKHKEKGKGRNR